MDFSFTSDQQDLRDARAQDPRRRRHARAREGACSPPTHGVDRDLWAALADAGLVGHRAARVGRRRRARVPRDVHRARRGRPRRGARSRARGDGRSAASRSRSSAPPTSLDGVADGTRIVTAALTEPVGDAFTPATTVADPTARSPARRSACPRAARRRGSSCRRTTGLYVVDPSSTASPSNAKTPRRACPRRGCVLGDAPADQARRSRGRHLARAARAGRDCRAWCRARARPRSSSPPTYTKEREQFGRPIATFQAVSQRAADTYIDTEAVRLTAWQAAWRLDTGLPATQQVAIAKFWAARGRAARGPRRAPPARWRRRRPRLPAVPLLPAGEADRARARLGDALAPAAGPHARRQPRSRSRSAPPTGVKVARLSAYFDAGSVSGRVRFAP